MNTKLATPISRGEALKNAQLTGRAEILYLMEKAAITKYLSRGLPQKMYCSAGYGWTGKCDSPCGAGAKLHTCAFAAGLMEGFDNLQTPDEFLRKAGEMANLGATDFKIVTTGCNLPDEHFKTVLKAYRLIHKKHPEMKLCASLGNLTKQEILKLKSAGVNRINQNIEWGERYAIELGVHGDWLRKMQTVNVALACGMEVCSGGMIFYGDSEKPEHRVDLYYALAALGVQSSSLNVYVPFNDIPALANSGSSGDYGFNISPITRAKNPTQLEILRELAIFRLIAPGQRIVLNAGNNYLGEWIKLALLISDNAAICGYLNKANPAILNKYLEEIFSIFSNAPRLGEHIIAQAVKRLTPEKEA